MPSQPGIGQIKGLSQIIDENQDKKFHLHTYLRGEDIIDKFANVIGLKVKLAKPIGQVNSSYTHEALQFKRMINTFSLAKIDAELDRALQGFTEGCSSYTYILKERHTQYQKYCESVFSEFCESYEVVNSDQLLTELTTQRTEVVKAQVLEPNELQGLLQFLQKRHKATFKKLQQGLKYAGSDKKDVQDVVDEVKKIKVGWW